jgi:hypothetical protein
MLSCVIDTKFIDTKLIYRFTFREMIKIGFSCQMTPFLCHCDEKWSDAIRFKVVNRKLNVLPIFEHLPRLYAD